MKKITFILFCFLAISLNSQVSFSESFDDVSALTDWDIINVSTTIGTTDWFQGTVTTFTSQSGDPSAYVAASFNATTGTNTINNWFITPVITLNNDDTITFYTRTSNANFPDRLEVRMSTLGAASTDPIDDSDVGSYTDLLLSVNPTLAVGGYPDTWTQQTITVAGLAAATDVRVGFRYWVTDGGPTGPNSSYIGIDELVVSTSTLTTNEFDQNEIEHYLDQNSNVLTLKYAKSPLQGLRIFNILGQEAMNVTLNNTYSEVSMANLQAGIYIAKVSANGVSKTIKLVIK